MIIFFFWIRSNLLEERINALTSYITYNQRWIGIRALSAHRVLRFLLSQKKYFDLFKEIRMYYRVPAIENLQNFTLFSYIFCYTLLNWPIYRAVHRIELGNSPVLSGPAYNIHCYHITGTNQ